jgi:flagellar biosynthetic protein FliQ
MTTLLTGAVREALLQTLILSAPLLVGVLAVGIVAGVLQVTTGVRDRAIAQVPKLVVAIVIVAATAPWMAGRLQTLLKSTLETVPVVARSTGK